MSRRENISPYCYERSELTSFSDDDSQAPSARHTDKGNIEQDSNEISHPTPNDDSSCYSSYYSQNFAYQEDYFMPFEDQQYYDEFYSASKSFINNYNLVDITQQRRDRQRAESNQIAVQVGNVLEIVPNAEIPSTELHEGKEIDPEELREKRKLARDRKRKLKKRRKEQLRKEIQRYFDEGINIEDSEEDEISVEPMKKSEDTVLKSIIKNSESAKNKDRRVMFGDGFYPFENSDHEEMSFQEKLNRRAIRKRVVHKLKITSKASSSQRDELTQTKKQAEYYENIPPPSPPQGQPSEKCLQPALKHIPPDLFASFSINFNPIYYFLQKFQYHQNGHHHPVKTPNTLSVRNICKFSPSSYKFFLFSSSFFQLILV